MDNLFVETWLHIVKCINLKCREWWDLIDACTHEIHTPVRMENIFITWESPFVYFPQNPHTLFSPPIIFSAVFHHMWILPVLEFHINGIMQSVVFLYLASFCSVFGIHLFCCIYSYFISFYHQVVLHCMAKPYLSIYLLLGICIISDVWLLWESF